MDPMLENDAGHAVTKLRWGQAGTIFIAVCALVSTLWPLLTPDKPDHCPVASGPETAQK